MMTKKGNEKTEQMFPEVSDEKTKRIIDSGLRKISLCGIKRL